MYHVGFVFHDVGCDATGKASLGTLHPPSCHPLSRLSEYSLQLERIFASVCISFPRFALTPDLLLTASLSDITCVRS